MLLVLHGPSLVRDYGANGLGQVPVLIRDKYMYLGVSSAHGMKCFL